VIDHDMIACWKVNYGLDTRTPADAMRYWDERCNGMAPAGAVAALGLCIEHIERLRAELAEARRELEAVNGESHADRCAQFDVDATSYGINRAENAWWQSTVSSACTLEAQLAEARKDAERYRWLKAGADGWIRLVSGNGFDYPTDKLDAAIDAARGEA
jgi:hypothetical protein